MSSELKPYETIADDFFAPLFDFFAPTSYHEPRPGKSISMKTDIRIEGDDYVMDIELPGVKKEDIGIDLQNGYLTIKATKNRPTTDKSETEISYFHNERYYGTASRSYYVGEVAKEEVSARFENGILTLRFPKEKKPEPATKIEIQ